MRSIVTVTTPPTVTKLVTLDRVKLELSITGTAYDDILNAKIDEATSDIESHIARTLNRATLTETLWGDVWCMQGLSLARAPVPSITSVTVDGTALAASEYRHDVDLGILYRIDSNGYALDWSWGKEIVVIYPGGFLLPGEVGRDLPPAIESAAISLVNSYWQSRGRDPLVKSENIPGLGALEYWVGAVGKDGDLPPDVMSKIIPFRRFLIY